MKLRLLQRPGVPEWGSCVAARTRALSRKGIYSAAYANVVSAFRRMLRAAEDAAFHLSTKQRDYASGGLAARPSAASLKLQAEAELNRLGLLPSLTEGTSAPGTSPASVPLALRSAPSRLPELAAELKRFADALLAIDMPAPAPEEAA